MFLGRPYRHRRQRHKAGQKVSLPLQNLLPAQEERAGGSQHMACGARGWMPPDLTVRQREDAWWNSFTSSHRSFCSCDDPLGHINTIARDNSAVAQTPTTTSGQGPQPPPPTPPRTPGPRPGPAPGKGRIRASWTYPAAPGGPGSSPWATGGAGDAGGAAGGGAGVLSAAVGGGDGDAGPGDAAGGGGDADVDDLLAAIEGDVGGDG